MPLVGGHCLQRGAPAERRRPGSASAGGRHACHLDARVKRLLEVMTLVEDAEFCRRFPAQRWARVQIHLSDGRVLRSGPTQARGDPENPLTDAELRDKYFALAAPVLGRSRADRIEALVSALPEEGSLAALLDELLRSAA